MGIILQYVFHVVCVFVPEKSTTHTSFTNPLQVTIEFPFNLLLSSELEELSPVLHTLSLFGKLPAGIHKGTHTHTSFASTFNVDKLHC